MQIVPIHSANPPVFEAAFIVLRESAEVLLLGQAATLGMAQAGHPELKQRYHLGTFAGIACGLALGAWLGPRLAESALAGTIGLVFMVSVVALTCTLLSSAMRLQAHAFDRAERWAQRPWARFAVLLVALVIGLRETLEAVFMLAALHQRQPTQALGSGVLLGLLGTVLMVLAYRTLRERVKLLALFRLSAVLVSLIAIQLLLEHAGTMLVRRLGDEHAAWANMVQAVLPGGAWNTWVCGALMVAPLWILARSWWWETSQR